MKKLFPLLYTPFLCLTALAPAQETLSPSPPIVQAQQQEIDPHALVVFGATGDLAKRKLFPSLFQLYKNGQLPDSFTCIAVGRKALTNAEFLNQNSAFIAKEDLKSWEALSQKITYFNGSYEELSKRLETFDNRLFYLATPESGFSSIIKELGNHNLLHSKGWSRIAIEKPFGHDSVSATLLEEELEQVASDEQIFRVDHYLAKNLTDELLDFRTSNPSIWNNQSIDHISITLSEDLGVETRGPFWEQTGLLRDVVQNHIMQLVSIVAMENLSEKARAIQSIRPIPLNGVIRGQYGPGTVNGKPVPGYRQELGVSPESSVETFVAFKLFVDNERWQGVPFYIKAGKRLSKNETKVVITFKEPIDKIIVKKSPQEAYQKVLREAMVGDHRHFTRFDELKASWDLFDPVLKDSRGNNTPLIYSAGSDGPAIKNENTNSLSRELVFK